MFQSYDSSTTPETGPSRLADLRNEMAKEGVDAFLVPRADVHQGEYVAPRDSRLEWLTGFTGSAGFACIICEKAGVFVDGRYRLQVRQQVADVFTPVDWPDIQLADWIKTNLARGKVAFDPWLHTVKEIETLTKAFAGTELTLLPTRNLVDAIWEDQPAAPASPVTAYPIEFAGESHADKRQRLAAELAAKSHDAAVITLPDSLCWLLNIRGQDIPRNPLAHGFAILHADASVDLFMAPDRLSDLGAHLGDDIRIHDPSIFTAKLSALTGTVRLDKSSAPMAVASVLEAHQISVAYGQDPCALPKACKSAKEIAGTTEAHLRDGAAVCDFLAWFDDKATTGITEIDVAQKLEKCRQDTGDLRDISFDTIAGTGPNGAVIHYRVTHDTNRTLQVGEIMVLDSGGQYLEGTTDITRTLSIGPVGDEEKRAFTLVLKGMIAVTQLHWPSGIAGQHIEAVGRTPLWNAGLDFDHGLGHGVGVYLCVHEGPQRLSRLSDVPLQPGMILSNEPGYYKNGQFGIRIENLVVVENAGAIPGGDSHRNMLKFRTLTYAPIDKRLIDKGLLTDSEIDWLNAYHDACLQKLAPRVKITTQDWLKQACAPL